MYNTATQEKVNKMFKKKMSHEDISKATGISLSTLKRWANIRKYRVALKKLISFEHYDTALKLIERVENQQIFRVVFISSKIKVLVRQEKFDEAKVLVKKELKKYPEDEFLTGQLINILIEKNEVLEAKKITQKALLKRPYDTRLINNLKYIAEFEAMHAFEVSDDFELSNPLFEEIRNQTYDYKNSDKSLNNVAKLKKYLNENPNDLIGRFVLAEAYCKMGVRELSINTCKEIINKNDTCAEDLKVFKKMIEIVRDNKIIGNDCQRKVNILMKIMCK